MRFIYIVLILLFWCPSHSQEVISLAKNTSKEVTVRACHLVFFEIYDVTYSRDKDNDTACINLDYLKEFTKKELADATKDIFLKLYGDEVFKLHKKNLYQIIDSYNDVSVGDNYKFCSKDSGYGYMMRNDNLITNLSDKDFNERFLKIWVKGIDKENKPIWSFPVCF